MHNKIINLIVRKLIAFTVTIFFIVNSIAWAVPIDTPIYTLRPISTRLTSTDDIVTNIQTGLIHELSFDPQDISIQVRGKVTSIGTFYMHLICYLLDVYFRKNLTYNNSHVTAPLGWNERTGEYFYVEAEGTEGPWEIADTDARSGHAHVTVEEWEETIGVFREAGIDISCDVTDPDDGRYSQNIIFKPGTESIANHPYVAEWKRIDFDVRSLMVNLDKLEGFIIANKTNLTKALGIPRLLLLEKAITYYTETDDNNKKIIHEDFVKAFLDFRLEVIKELAQPVEALEQERIAKSSSAGIDDSLTTIPITITRKKPVSKIVKTAVRVAISGIGRIGRLYVRQVIDESNPNIEIAAIVGTSVDTAKTQEDALDIQLKYAKNIARLLMHDTVHGWFKGHSVKAEAIDAKVYLNINGKRILIVGRSSDPAKLPWKELGIDIVIEASGKLVRADQAGRHILAGAERVIIGAPGKPGADGVGVDTYVYKVNSDNYGYQSRIISNASCTTNAAAPVVKVLNGFGLEGSTMVTTHAVTASQSLLDMAKPDKPESALAATDNIIDTSSGVGTALVQVFPKLAGKFTGSAMRVPALDGSIITVSAKLSERVTRQQLLAALQTAAEGDLKGTLVLDDVKVSGMIVGSRTTSIVVPSSVNVQELEVGTFVSMQVWYDNEAGYANQYIRMTEEMAKAVQSKRSILQKRAPPRVHESKPSPVETLPSYNLPVTETDRQTPSTPVRIALNGAGRISLAAIRQLVGNPNINLVAIAYHDINSLIDRLSWDSVFKRFDAEITKGRNSLYEYITINGKKIYIVPSARDAEDIANLPWTSLGIDIVLDTTGVFKTHEQLSNHIRAGAKRVILSAPGKGTEFNEHTYVYGVNSHELKDEAVLSGASCTTNALAPALKVLNEAFGVDVASMTTVHALTASQSTVDKRDSKSPERGRAAKNVILTDTGAAKAIGLVIPELSGKVTGDSLRVGILNGSVIILNVHVNSAVTPDQVNDALLKASRGALNGILKVTDDVDSSSQIIGSNETSIVSAKSTRVIPLPNNKSLIQLKIWYDNEWGYTSQILSLTNKVALALEQERIAKSYSAGTYINIKVKWCLFGLKSWLSANRAKAAKALGKIGPVTDQVIPALIKALEDSDWEVRYYAAKALGKIGPVAKDAAPALIKVLEDSDSYVRRYAAEALGKIGPVTDQVIPALVRALKGSDRYVHRYAAEALGKIGPVAKDAAPALIKALEDSDSYVRRYAAEALGKIGPVTDQVIPALVRALEDSDRYVHRYAAEAIDDLSDYEAETLLANTLLNYAYTGTPAGITEINNESQAIIVYSDSLEQSPALQAIIRQSAGDSREFYLVNKDEGKSADALLQSLNIDRAVFERYVFNQNSLSADQLALSIASFLQTNNIRQGRVFAGTEADISAWSKQDLIEALVMLLKDKRFEIISDYSDKHMEYIRIHELVLIAA
jgi:glyceraldehyde-3-phosphate dehydrogenase type I